MRTGAETAASWRLPAPPASNIEQHHVTRSGGRIGGFCRDWRTRRYPSLLRVPNGLREVWLGKDFGEYAQHEENVPLGKMRLEGRWLLDFPGF